MTAPLSTCTCPDSGYTTIMKQHESEDNSGIEGHVINSYMYLNQQILVLFRRSLWLGT